VISITAASAGHAVLDADDHGVRVEQWLDELRRPAGVVRLHEEEDHVERLSHLRHLAEMVRGNLRGPDRLSELHADAFRSDRLHVRGPLVDERDVDAGLRQIRPDDRPVRTGSQHRDTQRLRVRDFSHQFLLEQL
jgi:hypothetical protein